MADSTFEQALRAARSLPPEERRRLCRWLAGEDRQEADQAENNQAGVRREREMLWLREHEAEYAGQWIALDGDRLLSHAADPRTVYAEARAAGVAVPFVVFAEEQDGLQWGGWL